MQDSAQSLVITYIFALVSILLVGCSEPTFVGNDLVVDGQAFSTDTAVLPVTIYPKREDSLSSSTDAGLDAVSLGIISSPYFGTNKSGIFTEIILPANQFRFGENAVLDSMVLVLDYLAILGDTTGVHTIEVYEVTEEILGDTVLYSNNEFAYNPTPIGVKNNHVFNNTDDVILGDDTVAPQLRIPLDASLGERFLTENADTLLSSFDNNEEFQEWFKGIYITIDEANSTQNSMAFFNTQNSNLSRVVLYYTIDVDVNSSFSFPIDQEDAEQFIKLDTDYTGSGLGTLLTESSDVSIYSALAPMAGVNSVIEIPDLESYSDVIINKAELILPVIPFPDDIDTLYNMPRETIMFWYEDGETTSVVPDYISSSSLYDYEGLLITDDNTGIDYYKMNLALATQEVAQGLRESTDFILYQSPRRAAVRRVLLGSGNHPNPDYRPKLNLFFTEIE